MPNYAEEPLERVTLNLFAKDIDWLRLHYPNFSDEIRKIIRKHINLFRSEQDGR